MKICYCCLWSKNLDSETLKNVHNFVYNLNQFKFFVIPFWIFYAYKFDKSYKNFNYLLTTKKKYLLILIKTNKIVFIPQQFFQKFMVRCTKKNKIF